MPFSTLGISEFLQQALAEQGYIKPYPIQLEVIPVIIQGKDVLGIAQTGSGKTLSYVLPLLELQQIARSPKNRHISTLVLVPTRELAMQVEAVVARFAGSLPQKVKSLAVFGGVSINPQMIGLQGVDLLVATPGRLLDLVSSNAVNLSAVSTLVLDEADKMMNAGFREEMARILALLPSRRQNLLFSATLNSEIQGISELLLTDPTIIEIRNEEPDLELIQQVAYHVENSRKGPLLRYLIYNQQIEQVLVFTSSADIAEKVAFKLVGNGINAACIHGRKSQGARTGALNRFREGKLRVLVATDVVARGIDIPQLTHVINYELPRSPKDYIHRIGRTGRAGEAGTAISLVSPEELHHFHVIQKKMGKRLTLVQTQNLNLHGY